MVEQVNAEQWTDTVEAGAIQKPEKVAAEAGTNLSNEAIGLMGKKIGDEGSITLTQVGEKKVVAGDKAEKIKMPETVEALDRIAHGFGEKEMPLSNSERFMATALSNAINRGDLKTVSAGLAALSDNLDSAHRVLSQIRREMESKSTSVQFRTGRDQDGRPFVGLDIYGPKENIHATGDNAYTTPGWLYQKKAISSDSSSYKKLEK